MVQWHIVDICLRIFSRNLSDMDLLKNHARREDCSFFEVSDGEHVFTDSLSHKGFLGYGQWLGLNIQSVYIPTMDMLSHSRGFLALVSFLLTERR